MILPPASVVFDVIAATWPAAQTTQVGPWTIREGRGGGSRVSAASTTRAVAETDLKGAEEAMVKLGQPKLFSVRSDQTDLDKLLAAQGYITRDASVLYAAPTAQIATERPPPVTSFEVWPPLQVQRDVWAEGGIGEDRIAVMERAPHPKTTLLGRVNDRPAGTAFVGIAHGCAMIHALEVATHARRHGHARHLTRAAAFWAAKHGADYLTLVTTQANVAANALYTSLGMQVVGQYHYRIKEDD
ncbi:GNAT family N-acetyltransferase [Yoonia sp. 208BN28-4]|uniref:GNAT family N-acetyltransferase n=1 Tax=Yoonia sp. 208BN28-4 TaxID=3126505 RepID=UPI0030A325C4